MSTTGFHHSPRRVVAELAVLVGVLALGVWGGAALLRWAAERAVLALPVSVDRSIGESAAKQFSWPTCGGDPAVALGELADRFRPHIPEEFRDFRVHLADTSSVNAFALPGGNLYVLRGLVEQAESTAEIAGVLGHEVGHAVLRHGVRRIARQASFGLALSLVIGSHDAIIDDLIAGAARLQSLRFSRDEEREADRFSLELCARSGIDPAALGDFLSRLPDGAIEWLSTHPSSEGRRSDLFEMLRQRRVRVAPGPPLPDLDRLRGDCS